jgi:hypothetical protein
MFVGAAEIRHGDGNRASDLKGKSAIRMRKEEAGREAKGFANKNVWNRVAV